MGVHSGGRMGAGSIWTAWRTTTGICAGRVSAFVSFGSIKKKRVVTEGRGGVFG